MGRKPLGRVRASGRMFGQMDTSRVQWIEHRDADDQYDYFPDQCGLCGAYSTKATIQVRITVVGNPVVICRSCLSEINDFVPLDATQEEKRVKDIKEKSPLKEWVTTYKMPMELT